tara:strand:- start:779 stop:1249 length:471 start_codon:yes stop_codon:yes gene_type:complete
MYDQPKENPNNLRVVKTARTVESINQAAKEGFRPLIKPVEPSDQIHYMVGVFQHQETGEIVLSGDCRGGPEPGFEVALPHRDYYPYFFKEPFAAYLVPPDLGEGARVWIEDVIEDIVAVWGNQGYQPRLSWCEATWAEGDFTLNFDPNEDAPQWVG